MSMIPALASVTVQDVDNDLQNIVEYCTVKWDQACTICIDMVGTEEFEEIKRCRTCEGLLDRLKHMIDDKPSKGCNAILRQLPPYLLPFDKLIKACAVAIRSQYWELGVLWGLIFHLVMAAICSSDLLSYVVEKLDGLGQRLETVALYHVAGSAPTTLGKNIVEVFTHVMICFSRTLTSMRRSNLGIGKPEDWTHQLDPYFEKTTSKISSSMNHMDEKARALIFRLQILQTITPAATIRRMVNLHANHMNLGLSCHHIYLPENPHFFDRPDVLSEIRKNLDHATIEAKGRSVALTGMGGIGKTQIALAFAYEMKKRMIPAIFWINSATPVTIAQSFTDVAVKLGCDSAQGEGDGSDARNKYLVMEWLENVDENWLLIFDNVENMNDIRSYRPTSRRGSILITSRHEFSSIDLIAATFDVPYLSPKLGSKYMLNVIRSTSTETAELNSAEKLAEMLVGLPLALTMMAMQAKKRHMDLKRFLPFYEHYAIQLQQPDKLSLEPYYKHGLDMAWDLSFASLNSPEGDASASINTSKSNAVQLLKLLSLAAPSAIPVALFEGQMTEALPPELSFCSRSWEFQSAIENLSELSLLKRSDSLLEVHRVIQFQYRCRFTESEKRFYCHMAARLYCEIFPKQVNGLSLRPRWEQCKRYIQHILALCERLKEFEIQPLEEGEFCHLATCLSNAAWYLMECGNWSWCEGVLNTAFTLYTDEQTLIYAHLLNTAAYLRDKRNQGKEAMEYYEKSYKIRKDLLGPTHEEVANTLNNMGLAHLTLCQYEDAALKFSNAISIDMTKPENERSQILHIRHLNLGAAYRCQRQFDKARVHVEIGRQHAIKTFGPETHYDAVADFEIALMFYAESNFREARKILQRAARIYKEDNKMHPTTSATLYKLACVILKEIENVRGPVDPGQIDEALFLLSDAKMIAEHNRVEMSHRGDLARVLRKLAIVYQLKGFALKASEHRKSAETLRLSMQDHQLPDTEESYDMLVSNYYR